MSSQPLLGRCKQCDFALFADRDQVRTAATFNDMRDVGVPYLMDGTFFARCTKRHKVFKLNAIKGTYSESHKCDSRCLNAKGHDCTCSCGGMNHGRGYAVEVIDASAPVIVQANSDDATDKQTAFLRTLLAERVIPDNGEQTGEERLAVALGKLNQGVFTKRQASKTIEWLMTLPKLMDEIDGEEGDLA